MNAYNLLLLDNADIIHELDEVRSELFPDAVAEWPAVTRLAVRQNAALMCYISLRKKFGFSE